MAKSIGAGASSSASIIAATRAKVAAGSSLQTGIRIAVLPRIGCAAAVARRAGQSPISDSPAPQASQAVDSASRTALG